MRKAKLGGIALSVLSLALMYLDGVVKDKKMEELIAEEVEKAVAKKLKDK